LAAAISSWSSLRLRASIVRQRGTESGTPEISFQVEPQRSKATCRTLDMSVRCQGVVLVFMGLSFRKPQAFDGSREPDDPHGICVWPPPRGALAPPAGNSAEALAPMTTSHQPRFPIRTASVIPDRWRLAPPGPGLSRALPGLCRRHSHRRNVGITQDGFPWVAFASSAALLFSTRSESRASPHQSTGARSSSKRSPRLP